MTQRNKNRVLITRTRARAFRVHGLSREEFGKLTPAELHLLDEDVRAEREAEENLANMRHASLLSAIYNAPHTSLKTLTKPADFLPRDPLTDEEIAQKLDKLFPT